MDQEQQGPVARRAVKARWIEKLPRAVAGEHEPTAPPRLPSWARRTPSRFNSYQMTWNDAI
jgi:hypothetical protein